MPGEISLAHHGILFLDELPEFDRKVLEVLREPLESGVATIARAQQHITYPADFQLVAAMNPCPCGYYGSKQRLCTCSETQIQRYHHKLSGPLLDRIDLHVRVFELPKGSLFAPSVASDSSAVIRTRVEHAQQRQYARQGCLNHGLTGKQFDIHCTLHPSVQKLLEEAMEKLQFSARAAHRLIKVSRTIADLSNSQDITTAHLSEALSFREILRR